MKTTASAHRLELHNTLGNKRQVFIPRQEGQVKIFTCGPSIYGRPHLGNYRTFLYEDVLHRYLEYLGYRVERVLNFTDVEDKSIAAAGGDRKELRRITEEAAQDFFRNGGLLHLRVPDFVPRSSTSVEEAVLLIRELLARGLAYRDGEDVFYDPLKFPGFGKLYGLDLSRWPERRVRFRRDTYEGNRWNRGDFILWHGHRPERDGDVFWDTELGRGRPAWNVQDPAMIAKHLGYRVDIACGGVDNLYRHHDYTIAVLEGISGETFANYWLHGEHVLLDGKKMSKSKGNIVYPEDLLARGHSAATLRYWLISGHYREKLDLTEERLKVAAEECRVLRELARRLAGPGADAGHVEPLADQDLEILVEGFERTMNEDLQVGRACEVLLAKMIDLDGWRRKGCLNRELVARIRERLLRIDSVLQILFE